MVHRDSGADSPLRASRLKEIVLNVSALLLSVLFLSPFSPGTQTNAVAAVSGSSVGISVGQPPFGFNVLPGATRRVFATVTNGSTNRVQWSVVSGSATISSNAGSWIDVTAPSNGSSCSFTQTAGGYAVTSATQFALQATSIDDPSKTSAITFNVCNPAVQVSVVPFYRTLYANQPADVQSLVTGSTDQLVRWAITSAPAGGDGQLGDNTLRDTVFTATVPGRYVLTATSVADGRQSGSATMYVTGHPMPYRVTRSQTEPIDCTVDPTMLGSVYEVGPSQAFHRLQDVPFPTMSAGSTVRVHNEDTTGQHPTEYHEYVQMFQKGTAAQPIRVCGVPDAAGNLPVIDGTNATGRSDSSPYAGGYGLITLHTSSVWTVYPYFNGAEYTAIEGIHFRNAKLGVPFTAHDGSAQTWGEGSACVRVSEGHNIAVAGNEMDTCGNGAFSLFNANSDWGGSSLNILWEGNYIHGSGQPGSFLEHQMYLQAWGEVVQFNRMDKYTSGAAGVNLKSRGLLDVIRYNYFGDGVARDMDLVDVEDATQFMSFGSFVWAYGNPIGNRYSADLLAAAQEAWNSHFVYGNIYLNSSAGTPIHFAYDHSGDEPARKGNLYWYNNTFYELLCPVCSGQKWQLFDGSAGGGAYMPQTEYPTVQAFNNVIWMDDPTRPYFQWNNYDAFIGNGGNNLLNTNWGANAMTGAIGDGWNDNPNSNAYQNASQLSLHLTGFDAAHVLTTAAMPFDRNTWMLNSPVLNQAAMPMAACEMPARFAYLPSLGFAVPRAATLNVGATDTAAQTSTAMLTGPTAKKTLTRFSICH